MKVPDNVYKRIKDRLWMVAAERNWPTLSDQQKTSLYEDWIRNEEIGGALSRYLDAGSVRVYIKDTIMKPYGRERIKDFEPILMLVGLPLNLAIVETFIKPHGRRLADGKIICWGLARDWKAILFAVFERAFLSPTGVPYAAVIMFPNGKSQQPTLRRMIEAAAQKLGIQHLVWYDS